MKRFAWRLQRVLDIKRKEEETKKAELLLITERIAQTKGELFMQKSILANVIDSLTAQNPADRLGRQSLFLKSSTINDDVIRNLENRIHKLESQQKEKIAEVLEVKRYKEGLEKLRVEAKAEFIKEQEKLEQKELDEMTAISFARKVLSKGRVDNLVDEDFVKFQSLNKEISL